jgi:hypothetical protein
MFNRVPDGKIVAEVDGVELEIPGKLDNCQIASGVIPQEEGIASLKANLASEEQAVAAEAVAVALDKMKEVPIIISSTIWTNLG